MRKSLAALCLPMLAWPQTANHRISSPISFFEDADINAPGHMSLGLSAGYGRVYSGHDRSLPSVDFTLGIHRRVEVSASSGYAYSQFENVSVSGISDTYAGVKFLAWRQAGARPAVAFKPMVEILGTPSVAHNLLAPRRVNFVLPLILQRTFENGRVYYTGGYLTRGLQFHSVGLEADRWSRVTPSIVISHARLTRELGLVSELGLNRSRSDVLGILSVTLNRRWSLSGMGGRTFGRTDANSNRFQAGAGVAFNFDLWGKK